MAPCNRRDFLRTAGSSLAVASTIHTLGPALFAAPAGKNMPIYTSIKMGMFREKISLKEKFSLMKEMGYDGIELNSPGGVNKDEAIAASKETGLPIHGAVCSTHWGTRLSDPNPDKRDKAVANLKTAVLDTHKVGGSAVLLVPGRVSKNETQQQVWDLSTAGIQKVLPLSSRLGIHILIENVWNGFCYTHNGPNNQSADKLAEYLDHINSPWVGSYFDIGNHQKYGKPAEWIRTLGKRIVKLDVKDWAIKGGFGPKIGDGNVDWADVRKALGEIGYTGWATAEVSGGDRKHIKDVYERMSKVLGI